MAGMLSSLATIPTEPQDESSGESMAPNEGMQARTNGRIKGMPPVQSFYSEAVQCSTGEQWQRLKGSAEGALRRQLQPFFQHRGVDSPEVDAHFQVAVLQVDKAGRLADKSRLHVLAGQEDRRCGAVVRAVGAVLGDAPAELAEGQNRDAIGQPRALQIVQKRADGSSQGREQVGVFGQLSEVSIVTALDHVKDPRAVTGLEQLGY